MPLCLSPTSSQHHPRSRSSSPTRRVVSPITPDSQGSQRGRPAAHLTSSFGPERPRSSSPHRIIIRSPSRSGVGSPARLPDCEPLYLPDAPRRDTPRLLAETSLHVDGDGLLATCPGARVVDRKQCEREVSRIVVVTTELYDVRHPAPYCSFCGCSTAT
eukprot:COSAG02_NODE_1553_length_11961_cov_5.094335_10_plen_159_part_00